ncbi:MAG: glyoxylate/hydroxypyruvate reductase A [Cellvibrionaceae bacterium]|jgi:glyoxylate/hydroxypyruvate reductase A
MHIVFFGYEKQSSDWIHTLQAQLPQATIEYWSEQAIKSADYFVCRNPPAILLQQTYHLKAIFFLSAGIDYFLDLKATNQCKMLDKVNCYRLEDAGMSEQMMDYATYATLKFFRQFDRYDKMNSWQSLPSISKSHFKVGIMGSGELGAKVAKRLAYLGFSINVWSRTEKSITGMKSYFGNSQLSDFISNSNLLINLLPLNNDTRHIINGSLLKLLSKPSYLVNLARGEHVVEKDLVQTLNSGELNGAQIDVTQLEPLPEDSHLYSVENLSITPHNSAVTLMEESCKQIAEKIGSLHIGNSISGKVNWGKGY